MFKPSVYHPSALLRRIEISSLNYAYRIMYTHKCMHTGFKACKYPDMARLVRRPHPGLIENMEYAFADVRARPRGRRRVGSPSGGAHSL